MNPLLTRATVLVALATSLCSCGSVKQITGATTGHFSILRAARPIAEVRAEPTTSAELSEKLMLAEKIVRFAEDEMALPAGRSYSKYADIGREAVVWNVFAAEEFSAEAMSWWYPIVGSLEYRGYFSPDAAKAEAKRLQDRGHNAWVGAVEAYSTLGWTADPLLNTFIDRSEPDLVALLAHELCHRRIYFRGDSSSSEALAVAIEEEAVRRWYRAKGEPLPAACIGREDAHAEVLALFASALDDLRKIYAATKELPITERREAKANRLRRLEADYHALVPDPRSFPLYSRWFEAGIDNAHLTSLSTYHEELPKFRKAIADHGDRPLEELYRRLPRKRAKSDPSS